MVTVMPRWSQTAGGWGKRRSVGGSISLFAFNSLTAI